jgi:structure-specific recognition protein 1
MRSGQQLNHFLVFDFLKDATMVPTLQKEKMEAYGFTAGDPQPIHAIMAKLLKDFSGKTIVAPASDFKPKNGCNCIIASHKANNGYLFPMKKSMIFVNKPVLWIRYDDIDRVEFLRGVTRARSFDIVIHYKGGVKEVQFGQIDSQDIEELCRFLQSVGVMLQNHEPILTPVPRRSTASSSGLSPQHRIAAVAVTQAKQRKPATKPADDDDDEEEDDEDFENEGDSSSEDDLDTDDDESEEAPAPKKKKAKTK